MFLESEDSDIESDSSHQTAQFLLSLREDYDLKEAETAPSQLMGWKVRREKKEQEKVRGRVERERKRNMFAPLNSSLQ